MSMPEAILCGCIYVLLILWGVTLFRIYSLGLSLKRSREEDADEDSNGEGVNHFDAASNPNGERDHG